MQRIKSLGRYQKVILFLMFIMVLAFTVLYFTTIAREGFAYKNVILIPKHENGETIYTGEIEGKPAVFTVSENRVVEFQYDDKVYGPYTAKEDSTAIPEDCDVRDNLIGLELSCGREVIFRGGAQKIEGYWWLFGEDESYNNLHNYTIITNGIVEDENGNIIDTMEPAVSDIIDLMMGPELSHKGSWLGWFCGVFICFFTVISILFADEFFRLNLAFQIRDAEYAEPSDWEIASRYIAWFVLPIMALIAFLMGLQ